MTLALQIITMEKNQTLHFFISAVCDPAVTSINILIEHRLIEKHKTLFPKLNYRVRYIHTVFVSVASPPSFPR